MNLVLENSLKNFFDPYDLIIELQVIGKGEQLLVRSVINVIYIFCSIVFFFKLIIPS